MFLQSGSFETPSWLSQDSKELISHMLQVDPKRRITVDGLVSHPWLMKGVEVPVEWHSKYKVNEKVIYRKVPKFLDARKLRFSLPKVQEKKPNLWVFCQKDANGIANSDCSSRSSLIWVCTYCPDLFFRKLWIITHSCALYKVQNFLFLTLCSICCVMVNLK